MYVVTVLISYKRSSGIPSTTTFSDAIPADKPAAGLQKPDAYFQESGQKEKEEDINPELGKFEDIVHQRLEDREVALLRQYI